MEKRNIQTKTISHLRDARSILGDEILKEIDETEGLSVENIEIAKAIHSFTKTHPYFNRSAGEFGWNDFWGNFVSGLLSLDEGDPSSALWHFQDMKDVLYGHLYDIVKDAMFFEGIALFELGKFEEAKAVFLNCHEELKDSPDLHYILGIIYYELGSFPKAIERFTAAIDIDPEFMDAVYQRGVAYLHNDEFEMAMKDLQYYEQDRKHAELNSNQKQLEEIK